MKKAFSNELYVELQSKHIQERIAQFVVAPYMKVDYVEVNELDDTERGEGGFGSTGKK